jgi:hypothetical protein
MALRKALFPNHVSENRRYLEKCYDHWVVADSISDTHIVHFHDSEVLKAAHAFHSRPDVSRGTLMGAANQPSAVEDGWLAGCPPYEMRIHQNRLRELCQHILEVQQGHYPVNGIGLLASYRSLTDRERTEYLVQSCQQCLRTICTTLRIKVPVYLIVADLHRVPRFDALAKGLGRYRGQRVGFRLPPALRGAEPLSGYIEHKIAQMIADIDETLVYSNMQLEELGPGDFNPALTEFSYGLRQAGKGLLTLAGKLCESLHDQRTGRLYFRGVYLASIDARECAFTNQLITRMHDLGEEVELIR